eukprot:TRINITY_DN17863_c0_g2_i3.p1 TRINITY_DN17863_c0_g2~~TRINITY_DN17863_c0_g2_i3.p1  ORF type:complete len:192 (-),score=-12.21 TRINITY_DN17863_c0_g2_i3:60-635(-)
MPQLQKSGYTSFTIFVLPPINCLCSVKLQSILLQNNQLQIQYQRNNNSYTLKRVNRPIYGSVNIKRCCKLNIQKTAQRQNTVLQQSATLLFITQKLFVQSKLVQTNEENCLRFQWFRPNKNNSSGRRNLFHLPISTKSKTRKCKINKQEKHRNFYLGIFRKYENILKQQLKALQRLCYRLNRGFDSNILDA